MIHTIKYLFHTILQRVDSAGFNKLGNNALIEFIGPGKWLMNANGYGLKSGVYSGK
ncbi:hypothetical protein LBO01_15310 [Companilactobacillus paralimentarius]|nr:hypothetical protein LBO01_15310 [Companilactobacillus paralimentarius]